MTETVSGREGNLPGRVLPLLVGVALTGFALFKDVGGPRAGDFGVQQSLVLLAGLLALIEGLAAQRERGFPATVAAIERGDRFGRTIVRLVAFTVAGTWLLDFRDYVVDDSYISFRFARNLAEGSGLVWNPGEAPIEGFSNLAWTLLAAGSLRAGLEPLVVSRVVGAACALATLVIVHRTALRLTRSPGAAAVAPLALASVPALGFWAMSGLETTSVVLLMALASDALVREAMDDGWPWRTAVWSVLLALSRPEMPVAVALLVVPALSVRGRAALGWLGRFAALVAPPVLALVAWRWVTFGSAVPNTLVAKTHLLAGAPLSSAFLAYAFPLWLPVVLRFALGRAGALDRGAAALFAGWLAAALNISPHVAHDLRFFLPVLPPLLVSLSCACGDFFGSAAASPRAGRLALAALVAVTLAAPVFGMKRYATLESAGLRQAHARVAEGLRRRLPPGTLIAASDVGLIGYRSGMRVLDLWGLTDRRIGRHGMDPDEVLGRQPVAIVLHSLDEGVFEGREAYDRALHARLSALPGWEVVQRERFFGYWLWVFGRKEPVVHRSMGPERGAATAGEGS